MNSDNLNRIAGKATVVIVTLIAALVFAGTAAADDGKWRIRASGIWMDPDFDFSVAGNDGDPVNVSADDDVGFGLALEYLVSDRVGVELGIMSAAPNTTVRVEEVSAGIVITTEDEINVLPIVAALNFHLTPNSNVDFIVGPVLAYMDYGDLHYDAYYQDQLVGELDLETDSDIAWGLKAAVDVPIGDGPWVISAGVTYLDADVEGRETEFPEEGSEKMAFDPLIVNLGVGYRF